MAPIDVEGTGTPDDPWVLTTPPGKSEFEAYRDPDATPSALIVQVGSTHQPGHELIEVALRFVASMEPT